MIYGLLINIKEDGDFMKKLFLIGGTMGVGKTSVCRILEKELEKSVFLDGDWCWDSDPFVVTDETKAMVLDNICHLLNNFLHCSAYENIIFCWVMHEQEIIDSVIGKLDFENCEIKTVSLLADEACLKERLSEDIRKGRRSADIIGRSLERIPLYKKLDTTKIDTSGKSPQEIAGEIIKL